MAVHECELRVASPRSPRRRRTAHGRRPTADGPRPTAHGRPPVFVLSTEILSNREEMTPKREMGDNSPEIVISGQKVLISPEMMKFTKKPIIQPKTRFGLNSPKIPMKIALPGRHSQLRAEMCAFSHFHEFHITKQCFNTHKTHTRNENFL